MSAIELVCFHHAGGGPTSFNMLRRDLMTTTVNMNLTTVELPGRGPRGHEARHIDARACAQLIAEELADLLCKPHVLLGHSMGALLAYLVAQQRFMVGLRDPDALIVSAARAPHLHELLFDLDVISDHDLALELASYGGLPSELLAHPDWLEQLIPTVRDDLRMCQSFQPADESPLTCPLHIFGAYNDPLVPTDTLAAWSDYSVRSQPIRLFEGDHFFLRRPNPDLVAEIVFIADNAQREEELRS